MRALPLVLVLAACKPEGDVPTWGATATWEADRDALVVRKDGVERYAIPRSGLLLGTVPAYGDTRSYDPFWPDDTVTWVKPRAVDVTADGTDDLVLALTYDATTTATLRVHEDALGRWSATWTPAGDAKVAYFKLALAVDATERFYGLGNVLDTPNHRGKRRAMQTELDVGVESTYNEVHVPIPLLIGTRGWGLFVEDRHPMVWDVATDQPDQVAVTTGLGEASSDGLTFHLYAVDHPLQVTDRYWADTGRPKVPAPWALGPLVWRDENRDQAQVEDDLRTMRELDLAVSGVWIDRPYATGIQTFDFKSSQFPDAAAMIGLAHDLGFRVSLWHAPYLSDVESPALYQQAMTSGFFPPDMPGVFNPWGPVIDFTNPAASAFWTDLVKRYTDMGIEGFKLDYGEDVVVGLNGGRLPWAFSDGSDERTGHDTFPALYHKAYQAALDDDYFMLSRTGTYGDQTVTNVLWPGDLDADLLAWKEPATDRDGEDYVAVGGLEASLVYALSVGPSGYPFYGSDTGGYRHSPPDKETFVRWFEQTALSTVMQIGTSSNDVAWEPTELNGFDADTLAWYRDYTRLHQRLFPYLWTYAQQLADGGAPLMRPLGLAFPELEVETGDAYLLGDHLLVAPVMRRGARSREVPFPAGTWVDWFDGSVHDGDAVETVDAPLHKLPLYLAAGGLVPMLRPTIDTVSPVSDPAAVDSYDADPGVLWVRTTPGGQGTLSLYDGTELVTWTDDRGTELQVAGGATFTQGLMLESIATPRPTSVTIDGAPVTEVADADAALAGGGWSWSADAGGTLTIRMPAAAQQVAFDR